MLDALYTFDPDGDVTLVFNTCPVAQQESCPSSVADETDDDITPSSSPTGESNDEHQGKPDTPSAQMVPENANKQVRMLVSSKHMTLASPVFKAMLQYGNFLEGLALQSQGSVVVPLPDDDLDSFKILLEIIHGRLTLAPRQISLSQLTTLSVLVDKYQLHQTVGILSDLWIEALLGDIPSSMTSKDFCPWLCISWVFGRAEEFEDLTRIAQLESVRPLDVSTLPIPACVIDKIEADRQQVVRNTLTAIETQIKRFQGSISICRTDSHKAHSNWGHLCDSMILGSLLKSAARAGLGSDQKPPFYGLSVTIVARHIHDMDIQGRCDTTTITPTQPPTAHGAKALIDKEIQRSRDRLDGLELADFKGQRGAKYPQ